MQGTLEIYRGGMRFLFPYFFLGRRLLQQFLVLFLIKITLIQTGGWDVLDAIWIQYLLILVVGAVVLTHWDLTDRVVIRSRSPWFRQNLRVINCDLVH